MDFKEIAFQPEQLQAMESLPMELKWFREPHSTFVTVVIVGENYIGEDNWTEIQNDKITWAGIVVRFISIELDGSIWTGVKDIGERDIDWYLSDKDQAKLFYKSETKLRSFK